jgi:hypothetical protein
VLETFRNLKKIWILQALFKERHLTLYHDSAMRPCPVGQAVGAPRNLYLLQGKAGFSRSDVGDSGFSRGAFPDPSTAPLIT